MFEIGSLVVYKREVCKIVGKKEKHFLDKDYYVMQPIDDSSLTVEIPVDRERVLLREVISYDEVQRIIGLIPLIGVVECQDKMIENEYKLLMASGKIEDLVKIIKTTYLRNAERIKLKKKISEKDDDYFKKAEKMLYTEFSVALGMSYEETKDYILQRLENV